MKKTKPLYLMTTAILLVFLQLYTVPLSHAQNNKPSQAEQLMEQNNFTEAIGILENQRNLSLDNKLNLAICYLNTAEPRKALDVLNKMENSSDKPMGYHYILGHAYARSGRHVHAVANWHRYLHKYQHKFTKYEIACIEKKIDLSLGKIKPENTKDYKNINLADWYLKLSQMVESETATLSQDGSVFVFSAEHSSDSASNNDLFYAVKDNYGLWSKFKPFVTDINSSESEIRPVFQPNSNILQFSRTQLQNGDGIPSIFQTRFNKSDCSWEKPLPLEVFVKKAN
ncbi:hypothetical protein R9C00_27275 [Flammeovirgaceae bacterium SG7u.111]|nr:hypothetical protein [Flammeovirgaceae bacterium SG7u.132]WPO35403.1 hypothetical protein R9C00_27275 [Flammeovirgaceae bacterium SG7u.111]